MASSHETMLYKILNGMAPSYLLGHILEHISSNVSSRRNDIRPPFPRTGRYDNSFFPFCITNCNNLGSIIKSSTFLSRPKTNLNKSFVLKVTYSFQFVIVLVQNY